MISFDLYTAGIERNALYSRATTVISILKSLGPTKPEQLSGIIALSSYISSKRSKGRTDRDILLKLSMIENKVPVELHDVFVKAKLKSKLAPPSILNLQRPRPTPMMTSPPTSPSMTNVDSLSPSDPSITMSDSDCWSTSTPQTPTVAPYTSSFSLQSISESSSIYTNDTHSSFSAPDPNLHTPPKVGYPWPPSPHISSPAKSPSRSRSPSPSSSSFSSLGYEYPRRHESESGFGYEYAESVPSLLSPLSLGGWGRGWERPYLDRESIIDGISLESFPRPPARDESPKRSAHDSDSSWLSLGLSSPFSFDAEMEGDEYDDDDGDGDGETITGPASSRWSAVLSESSFGDMILSKRPAHDQIGPSEASLIRDA